MSTFFEYPMEVRKIIYTTNIIEGLNRQFRQIKKNKPSFTNDDSLRRMLYLASIFPKKSSLTNGRNFGNFDKYMVEMSPYGYRPGCMDELLHDLASYAYLFRYSIFL